MSHSRRDSAHAGIVMHYNHVRHKSVEGCDHLRGE